MDWPVSLGIVFVLLVTFAALVGTATLACLATVREMLRKGSSPEKHFNQQARRLHEIIHPDEDGEPR